MKPDHQSSVPLCVDLDGTLIRTDLLVESFFQLIKGSPLYLLLAPLWLFFGKAHLKSRITERVELDPSLLPYNDDFLQFIKSEKAGGRRLILVTASHEIFARRVADYLGLFEDVLATDSVNNLSGRNKREALVRRYGTKGFDYAGNATPDLAVWQDARHAIVVSSGHKLAEKARTRTYVEQVFNNGSGGTAAYIQAMRPHQWMKNLLLFIPLLVSHKWNEPALLLHSIGAFIAFSLCASGVYLLNDLMDLPDDRRHERKRTRPFAAGSANVKTGTILASVTLLAAGCLSALVTPLFFACLVFYFLTTLAYSAFLKRIVLIDVFVLAGLYTIRIIAGAAAIMVTPSFWLLAFSIFLFTSLAMLKRFSELLAIQQQRQGTAAGRGYRVEDLETLGSHGASAGYLSVLVLALYVNSPDVRDMYSHPDVIWMLCPILLYWISRVWLVARRGNMDDDPVIFAMRDRISRVLAIAVLSVVLFAL